MLASECDAPCSLVDDWSARHPCCAAPLTHTTSFSYHAAADAEERAKLAELYEQYRGDDDYLQRIADAMPTPLSAKKVLRLLRKHGLVAKPVKQRLGGGGGGSQRKCVQWG